MGNTSPSAEFGIIQQYLDNRSVAVEEALREACARGDVSTASSYLHDMMEVARARRAADAITKQKEEEIVTPTYMLSTFSIQQALNELTTTETEDLRFATGLAVGPKQYVITSFCQFKMNHKSLVAAAADHESMTRVLIGLHELDHKLLMTAHSHPDPVIGFDSTAPSSVDIDFHKRLEAANYPCIGMIVNRKGYVRFYSYQRSFEIHLFGKGMEVINERNCLFKLTSIGSL